MRRVRIFRGAGCVDAFTEHMARFYDMIYLMLRGLWGKGLVEDIPSVSYHSKIANIIFLTLGRS